MRPLVADKVRIRAGLHRGARGRVTEVAGATLAVQLQVGSTCVRVRSGDVINYSLAARKAWRSLPHRAVGRPKGTKTVDRVSVTLRIDRKIWEDFQAAEASGLIRDRTEFFGGLLRKALTDVRTTGK